MPFWPRRGSQARRAGDADDPDRNQGMDHYVDHTHQGANQEGKHIGSFAEILRRPHIESDATQALEYGPDCSATAALAPTAVRELAFGCTPRGEVLLRAI